MSSIDGTKSSKAAGRVLLPSEVVPVRYDIKLKPNLETFTFDGEESIDIDVSSDAVNSVTLHAKELCFISASYTPQNKGETMEATEINLNIKATTVKFCFPSNLALGAGVLRIVFSGFLNNQMAGFYRSKYTDINGVSKTMASTQFESLDARRAFPCWDEPAAKAVFGITLVVPAHLTAFSNMPERARKTLDGGTMCEIQYLDSPKMSSYLVAFCLGEFDFVSALTENGVLVKVYTPPGKSAQGMFALECATKSLDLYDEFFGIKYPLPKLDMVAIPEFAMWAMENWGLVTYREVDLLIDEVKASSSQKQQVCTVVTHELAHQWFGNLVTMAWWDDLWLNEGFASWAENYAAHALFPKWRMWDQFTTGHLAAALRLDALRSSHPIQVPIAHAEEVEEVFDAISYCKGGSVVKMIRAVLGKAAFQQGLEDYMTKYQYSNTETFHLWDAWELASKMPIGEMMKSWTEQMGFPLLTVEDEKWEDKSVTLTVKQSWFLSDGSELKQDEAKTWCIPIMTCTAAGIQSDMTWMREETAQVTIPLNAASDWVKLNANQEVPMRVCYSKTMIDRLSGGISSMSSPADRAGLLADSYALVKSGAMKPEVLLKLLSSYESETDCIVWESIESVLGGLHSVMSDDDAMAANFSNFAKKIVINLTNVVSWDASPSDEHLTSLLRGAMVRLLSKFCAEDTNVVNEAKTRFQKFLENPDDVVALPSDMRGSVFAIILKSGGSEEYESVLSYFETATDNAERKHVFNSLGYAPDPKLKLRTLEWATSGVVKLQDFFYPMGAVGRSSRGGREISWKFYQNNFEKIKGMIGKGSPSLMDACIVNCCGAFCSKSKADEIDAFFTENPLPSSSRKITQMTENMRANGQFLEKLQESELTKDAFWSSL